MDFNENSYPYNEELNYGILKYISSTNKYKILDVACGTGVLGEELKRMGHHVTGIDINLDILNIAKNRLNEVYCYDVTKIKEYELFKNQKFNIIIFGDILEHLYNPLQVLIDCKQLLDTEGKIIISVPNIAVWFMRLKLLFGNFDYQETGTLDKTHIRFFTKKTVTNLVKLAGYKITNIHFTPYLVRIFLPILKSVLSKKSDKLKNKYQVIMNSPLYKFYIRFIYPIELVISKINYNFFAYQFIIVAKK